MSTSSENRLSWQVTRNSVRERSKYMFNNSLMSDVKFSVGGSECDDSDQRAVIIPAHKFILAISSPVFFAMFYGEMAESRDVIEIPDCSSESFLELLRFLYYDDVWLTGGNVIEVLYLAKKYMIPSLSDECSKFLQENLNTQNVFCVLPGVCIYDEAALVESCWEIVGENTEEALRTEAFLDISLELLVSVLERGTLIVKEVEVFRAVDRWAGHQLEAKQCRVSGAEKRALLGDAVNLIRFPLMTEKEFASLVPKTEILTYEDTVQVFLYYNDEMGTPLKFSNAPRRGSGCIPKRAVRFNSTVATDRWFYDSERPELLSFSVNRGIRIHGVRLFGSEGACYSIKIALYHKIPNCSLKQKLTEEVGKFGTDAEMTNGYYGYDITFKNPVSVKKNEVYELYAVIDGPPSYYGTRGQTKVAVGEFCLFSFSRINSEGNCTTVGTGQFSEILFV